MDNLNEAFNRIRVLECPTGDLENRVAGILGDYGIVNGSSMNIDRASSLDREDAQAYVVKIVDDGQSFVILAQSGYDDYVAKVVDIYRIS